MRILTLIVLLTLVACGRSDDEEYVKLEKKYWVCTSTHIWHHPRMRRNIKFGGGYYEAYDSIECDQWSAKFDSGRLGGDAKADERYRP